MVGLCLHTTHSSQGPKLISWYLRQSTTEPFHTTWNSFYMKFFKLAADPTSRSSTYSIQHSSTTKKKHPSYNIAPCDEHSTSIKKQIMLKPIFWRTQPPLGVPRLPSTRRAALLQWATSCWLVSPHHPQQPGREAHRLIFPTGPYGATQHLVKQLLREVLPLWQPMQLPTGQQDATHRNHKTALIRQHWTM